jgi:uncharacterized protein YecT (DUF1311 family)
MALDHPQCLIGAFVIFILAGAANAQNTHPHVAEADREYAAVFSQEGNPCAKEQTTLGYASCIGKELEFTEKHLEAFLAAVRGIVTDEDGGAAAPEVAGKVKELDLLNAADRAWREYKKNLCGLQFAGMYGGSGAPSTETECEYRADRLYVQEVADAVFLKISAK